MKTEHRRLGLLGLALSTALALGACSVVGTPAATGEGAKPDNAPPPPPPADAPTRPNATSP